MLAKKKVVVIGSTNMDMVVKTENFPKAGETVIGGEFLMNLGGKGANQAVAAARLSADVIFVTRLGNDLFGEAAIRHLNSENINISYLQQDSIPSGVALIVVDHTSENNIVVAPGANANLFFTNELILSDIIDENVVVLMQLEIPIETIERVCVFAKKKNATVILNPAPSQPLSPEILSKIDIITPNQEEAYFLSGIHVIDEISAKYAAEIISQKGPKVVLITMGSLGAFVYQEDHSSFVESYKVKPVDSTGAGDVFNGALAANLAEGQPIVLATEIACKAAAISVTRFGAQASAPTKEELKVFIKN